MNNEPHLVQKLEAVAREMDLEAQSRRITDGRIEWQRAAAGTRLCAVLVSEGVRGFDAAVGYAWLKASRAALDARVLA